MPVQDNHISIQSWVRIAFINLLIVAFLGVIMRYKIAYSLPFIEQKNLLHAHSHFAFTGWVTQVLMALMVAFLQNHMPSDSLKKYGRLLIFNLISAYSMLLTFPWEGYGLVSIIFSTLSLLASYLFAIAFWFDLDKIKTKTISAYWFKAALLFNVLSSFGAFFLSYMMANKIQHPSWFLASTYYFLHFQYNGWFFFACMGLLNEQIKLVVPMSIQKRIFWLFALACIPAYFLSALWLPIPTWVYILVVCAAAAQLLGWVLLLKQVINKRSALPVHNSGQTKWLYFLAAIALSIKLLLQLGSTIPFLAKLAFGFRPVVIGYLHLMFLGVISIFIIGFCKMNKFVIMTKAGNTGVSIFVAGIIINELFLLVQGFSYMNYINVPNINELLLGAAIIMLAGLILMNMAFEKDKRSIMPPPANI